MGSPGRMNYVYLRERERESSTGKYKLGRECANASRATALFRSTARCRAFSSFGSRGDARACGDERTPGVGGDGESFFFMLECIISAGAGRVEGEVRRGGNWDPIGFSLNWLMKC